MRTQVLVISGSMGCGKTTVLGEASDILSGHDILHAAIDLDAVGAVLVPVEVASGLAQRNLAAIYANFVNAGVKHVLLAEAVETRADLDGLCGAMPGADFVICRLTAAPATMERRLRVREPGMHQERFVSRARELQSVLDAAKLEDFTVLNDERTVTDVAREVLNRAGWIE